MRHDTTVIIRYSGERTFKNCLTLLKNQVPEDHIIVIEEFPFERAVKRTFEVAIDMGLDWTVVVDADMLLHSQAIEMLVKSGESEQIPFFSLNERLLDKFFCGSRPGAPHLYRTSLCKYALKFVPQIGETGRPETIVKRRMAEQGHPAQVRDKLVVALHDFEQFYRDIFRKAYTHGHKHRTYRDIFEKLWRRLSEYDDDYRVALWGLETAHLFQTRSQLDRRVFPESLDDLLVFLGLTEKSGDHLLSSQEVDHIIATYETPPEYAEYIDRLQNPPKLIQRREDESELEYRLRTLRWRFIPWVGSRFILKIGYKLNKIAKK